jgi:hypothetical protein
MKKMLFLVVVTLFSSNIFGFACNNRCDAAYEDDTCYSLALSAGYVFKNDCQFKDVYGHGIVNIITVDGCYYPWECWGVGAKVSYWRTTGQTDFLQQCTTLQEVPFIIYLRRRHNFDCGLQLYGSLGGGVAWIREESYLGCAELHKGIGEIEIGLNYPLWRCLNIMSEVRYLFPPQCDGCEQVDVGGVDLRLGFEIGF